MSAPDGVIRSSNCVSSFLSFSWLGSTTRLSANQRRRCATASGFVLEVHACEWNFRPTFENSDASA